MGYVSKSLVTGEHIVYEGRFHWSYKLSALVWLVLILPGLIMLIYMWSTEIAITNRRLIYKRGWIARRTDEINLNRIEEVNLKQGLLGRVLGYGKVVCKGTGSGDIDLPVIGAPMQFKRALQEAQAQSEAR